MYSYRLSSSWKIAKIGKISQLQAQTAVSYSIADIQTKNTMWMVKWDQNHFSSNLASI